MAAITERPANLRELIERTGLSAEAVHNALNKLASKRLIHFADKQWRPGEGKRRPRLDPRLPPEQAYGYGKIELELCWVSR